MKKTNINVKKGFTIIEVVLVLAIAGLIFLMVFVALPNLQRSQRDTQRRNDYSQLAANITSFTTNNGGNLPHVNATLQPQDYINETGNDPYGNTYNLTVDECTGASNNNEICEGVSKLSSTDSTGSKVVVVRKAVCAENKDGESTPSYQDSNRAFVVYGQLESGTYCQEG